MASPDVDPRQNISNYIIGQLQSLVRDLEASSAVDSNLFDYVSFRLEQVILTCLQSNETWNNFIPEHVIWGLISAYNILKDQEMTDGMYENIVASIGNVCPESEFTDNLPRAPWGAGRPSFDIPVNTLKIYLRYGFSIEKIAKIFCVSSKTIHRRIATYKLKDEVKTYSYISDSNLNSVVEGIFREFPNCGIRRMKGFLAARGYVVQWRRVRYAMWSVDPEGILLRKTQLNIVNRRRYWVPGTLALWHLDGNHKLIRWRFVVHGCVDGYSRKIMFLQCSTNNQASTVCQLFLNAVERYGLPSRVRGDQGVENVDVASYMFNHPIRGPGRGSYLSGKSCHNQRIEHFWRDLFHGCLFLFYYTFSFLEDNGYLSVNDEIDLFCLEFVFLPRINRHLCTFRDGFDNHPIRTESNMTPNMLWVLGQRNYRPCQGDHISDSDLMLYGVDFEGPLPSSQYNSIEAINGTEVVVPDLYFTLTDQLADVLKEEIDPLANSDSNGIDIYLRTRNIIRTSINQL